MLREISYVQWLGPTRVSSSTSDYKNIPISFSKVYSYTGITTLSNYGVYGSWIQSVSTTRFLSGVGPDWESAADEKITSIFIGI